MAAIRLLFPSLLVAAFLFGSAGDTFAVTLQEARQLRRSGQVDQAIEAFRALHEQNPQDADVEMELVWSLLEAGKTSEADSRLHSLRNRFPERTDMEVAQANLFARTGQSAKARKLYERVLIQESSNYDAWMGLGRLDEREQNETVARTDYERALELVPESVEAREATRRLSAQETWSVSSWFSYSALTNDRPDWTDLSTEIAKQVSPSFFLTALVTNRRRFGMSDSLYGLRGSFLPTSNLELHLEAIVSPSMNFSAGQAYRTGFEWRAIRPVSVLFDFRRMNYSFDDFNISIPGLIAWFTDRTYLKAQAAYGVGQTGVLFHNMSFLLNIGLPEETRLQLGFLTGANPDHAEGLPGTLLISSVYETAAFIFPVSRNAQVWLQYEHEQIQDLYSRNAGVAGIMTRF